MLDVMKERMMSSESWAHNDIVVTVKATDLFVVATLA